MRHRKGINLARPADYAVDLTHDTLGSLPEMFVLVAACPACHKRAPIDRWDLGRQLGKRSILANVAKMLKCSRCGNRAGNRLLLGKLPRD
ncbi:hypothetical protein ATY81_16610 [Rhizobium sp. R72]|uniref:hypothetical protein n=1 Tax=unclassified Rhizobium TaxID=2613769 RepID=UPI000B534246|nr:MULTISPECIES: hypothetical protein [unclassified Rhizobium]OWV92772.1 hypothetical protein ATY81_16610 [Rhizobium sp. R72]OWV92983.1 hypothetical protein ATY80_16610 [Rhizobium sp. R711]